MVLKSKKINIPWLSWKENILAVSVRAYAEYELESGFEFGT